ncbi:Hypothetical predicted protein [Mytilus galloprovincialis]|uniref:non-specific serine/threonine protein kinase n=1 Tax=Mytilus galloprovincialis TaxID=29158 RepID=A0A8B6HF12_MYTGA|nr:Hypothetical predicted protein [Mytilus galloprovincialis]
MDESENVCLHIAENDRIPDIENAEHDVEDDDDENHFNKESVYDNICNVSRNNSNSTSSEHLIPHEFLDRNETAVEAYKDCLKLGKERRNKVRIIVVGPKSSGKTCIVRRLLQKGIKDVKSTNGIEIHISKCKAKLSDMKWIFHEELLVEEDVKSRLLKSIVETYNEIKDTRNNSTYENYKKREESEDWYDTVETPCTYDDPGIMYENIGEDLHDLCEILKSPLDVEEFAPIDFWDFAGDKEYYYTHNVFLSKDAIYIVTFDVSKTHSNQEESSDDLKFWLETIRCYGSDHSTDDDEKHKDPSVFIVGTHKDKFKENPRQGKEKLLMAVNNAIENEKTRKHVGGYFLVSNTEDLDEDFEKLRNALLQTAKEKTSWNDSRPVRWIYLEKSLLDEITSGQFVITKTEILQIAANSNQPICDPEEVEAFLVYHHGIGTYTYFKDLPDYVVLFPQWLADAFRCIIFADMFQVEVSIIPEWNQFRITGRLSKTLLDRLFSFQSSKIREHRDHILAVMEKFHIIVHPKIMLASNEIIQETDYFVPCMIRTKHIDEVVENFKCESQSSSWLCFEFEFLPPPLITSLLVAYSHKLTVVSIVNFKSDNEPVFYSNFALFYLKDAKDEMLFIAAHKNILQMQVWKWSDIKRSYCHLRQEFDELLQRLGRLFQMKLCYKTKLKCSAFPLASGVGMEDIDHIEEKKQYLCQYHHTFHCTDHMYADWVGTLLEKDLSKEQINAARMSIIILGVLTDALYDRLAADSTPSQSRTTCDITYLYAELRRQNRHIPTKGVWGGRSTDIHEKDKKIGDDIERIRLIRNEIQHLPSFAIDNTRYKELCRLVRTIAKRMGTCNNKSTYYIDGVTNMLQQDISHNQLEEQEKMINNGR